jgi:hypothetical protein
MLTILLLSMLAVAAVVVSLTLLLVGLVGATLLGALAGLLVAAVHSRR